MRRSTVEEIRVLCTRIPGTVLQVRRPLSQVRRGQRRTWIAVHGFAAWSAWGRSVRAELDREQRSRG